MVLASILGPTRRLVPVSRMASQPSVQAMVVSTPTAILFKKREGFRDVLPFPGMGIAPVKNQISPFGGKSFFLIAHFRLTFSLIQPILA